MKSSKRRYNSNAITVIILSSLLPFIVFLFVDWVVILTSSVITILTSLNYIYNLKNEWETHLYSYINLKGLKKEWELTVAGIRFSKKSADEKITEYFTATDKFLKEFNAYELEEIKGYFLKLREFQQSDKNAGKERSL